MESFPYEIQRQLIDTLCEVFWYKTDLLRYLNGINIPRSIFQNTQRVMNEKTKRAALGYLIDELLKLPENQGQIALEKMIQQMSQWSSFNTVVNPEIAKKAVSELARLVGSYTAKQHQKQNDEIEIRKQVQQQAATAKKFEEQEKLLNRFFALVGSTNPQERGHDLEHLLHELFRFENLNPGEAFAIKGEQIDGAFELDGIHYLVEAKWIQNKVQPEEVSWFQTKIQRRLVGTRGLMISINEFTDEAIRTATESKCIILMSGDDLYHVLDPRVDLNLKELLRHKIAKFSRFGLSFTTAREMLQPRK